MWRGKEIEREREGANKRRRRRTKKIHRTKCKELTLLWFIFFHQCLHSHAKLFRNWCSSSYTWPSWLLNVNYFFGTWVVYFVDLCVEIGSLNNMTYVHETERRSKPRLCCIDGQRDNMRFTTHKLPGFEWFGSWHSDWIWIEREREKKRIFWWSSFGKNHSADIDINTIKTGTSQIK